MSGTKWTNEQWQAITEKNCNLLVAAAAGAGKTAVLVERIIKKITDENDPLDIDRLLVVTFTNATATEMRERISEAISSVLEKNPDSHLIQRQLALLGKASITTIHSFCLEVIRNNFHNIDIDPGFRIADETESSLLKLEALNKLFEEQYENKDNQDFFELLESYGGNRDDQILMDMVLSLYDFTRSSPWPEEWLLEMSEGFNIPEGTDFGQTNWGKVLKMSVRLELEGLRNMLKRAIELIKTGLGLEKYLELFYGDLNSIEGLITLINNPTSTWDRLFSEIQSIEFDRLPRLGKEIDKERQEAVKKIRDNVKGSIKKLREKIIISDSARIIGDLKFLYPLIKCLSGLVQGLSLKYIEKKNSKSILDFNDLEHLCLDILSERDCDGQLIPSSVALSYRERYKEIMVDEYQDSNLVQEIILNLISGSGSPGIVDSQCKENQLTKNSAIPIPPVPLFMVGDVKQSIYRFRQARPELFLEKYNTYSSGEGEPYRKILLFKNFRSRRTVVDAVNFIFKQIMSATVGELDYTDTEALNPGAIFPDNVCEDLKVGGQAELHLIQTSVRDDEQPGEGQEDIGENSEEEEEILDNIQCEARLVANRILEILKPDEEGRFYAVWDKSRKEYRRAEFRDIVILLRTTKNWAEIFTEEFALLGIPAFADTGSGFFKTIEVQVVLSLLQIIDNPLQDIPLLSVLRSPIVSFTTDELARLRLIDRRSPLFVALCKLAEDEDHELSGKASAFLDNLQRWRNMAQYLSTDKLIWRLYNETGYFSMVGAMPAGEQRQANLRVLFERARQFEQTSYKGLFNFINFIDKLKGSRGDMGSAKTLSENDNVVRIMSIHKSKGLEFPIVFLSGCGKRFNLQDMNKSILLHQDLGFGPDVVDHRLRLSWPSAAKLAIREKIRVETLSEEMRILYVALTRAREKLIITGAVNDLSKAAARWTESCSSEVSRLPDYEMLKSNNYLDWICPALIRHKDCTLLRQCAPIGTEYHGAMLEDPSGWSIRILDKSNVSLVGMAHEAEEDGFISWLDRLTEQKPTEYDQELINQIDRRLGWEYPYKKASLIPAKISVTELKRRYNTITGEESQSIHLPRLIKKPGFLETKKGFTQAEKGTFMHFVMQHIDMNRLKDCLALGNDLSTEIGIQIDSMVGKDLLTFDQAETVDIERMVRFFTSKLGKRMLASETINRETPFNIAIPCTELYSDMTESELKEEAIMLQGVIDCWFEETDGIVLVDYKTDYVPEGRMDIIKERYRLQIEYYSHAIKRLSGKPVKERYIYLFWNGEVLGL